MQSHPLHPFTFFKVKVSFSLLQGLSPTRDEILTLIGQVLQGNFYMFFTTQVSVSHRVNDYSTWQWRLCYWICLPWPQLSHAFLEYEQRD